MTGVERCEGKVVRYIYIYILYGFVFVWRVLPDVVVGSSI